MSILIRNGTVVTAESTFPADILVDGEKIKEVRQGIPLNAGDRVLDAELGSRMVSRLEPISGLPRG